MTSVYPGVKLLFMMGEDIVLTYVPELHNVLFIAGFDGWGNALDISRGTVEYMIRKLGAEPFGTINPDRFYSFDENRPLVEIKDGMVKTLSPPGGHLYWASEKDVGRDIILLQANEPNLRWSEFIDAVLSLCRKTGVQTIISLGSMYDSVLHTDTIISGIASSGKILAALGEKNILPISYQGPSAIHSSLHSEACKQNFESLSLWCHCPHYLRGTTHFGLLSHMGTFLAEWGDLPWTRKSLPLSGET